MALLQPQNSLSGANAGTTTPQTMQAPLQLNANAMNQQVQKAQLQGKPTAQAVNQAANNPANKYYAKGGPVPPTKEVADRGDMNSPNLEAFAKLIGQTNALKPEKGAAVASTKPSSDPAAAAAKEIDQYSDPTYQAARSQMAPMPKYAKGGPVGKDASLKDIVKMLASHPDVMGNGARNGNSELGSTSLKKGGEVTSGKSEAHDHARGLLSMNDDVGSYAKGGPAIKPKNKAAGVMDPQVTGSPSLMDGKAPPSGLMKYNEGGPVKMETGGGLEGDTEADNITSYAPDGTPIIQNADGTQGYGDINQLLGRPAGTSTLGTGESPTNATTQSAGNMIGSTGSSSPINMMAKGGEEGGNAPPPGANSDEVADDIPAKLSGGEFVFSADVTRFYGLRTLHMMMDHARQELAEMNNDGSIRHPGDGQNANQQGQFLQDQKPNTNAYGNMSAGDDDGDEVKGLLKECRGGYNMASGGDVTDPLGLSNNSTVQDIADPLGLTSSDSSKSILGKILPGNITGGLGGMLNPSSSDLTSFLPGVGGGSSGGGGGGLDPVTSELSKFIPSFLMNKGGLVNVAKGINADERQEEKLIKAATGGGIGEEQSLAKGGNVYGKGQYPVGRDNMVSPHPKGGGVQQDYAKGGVVSASMGSLTPKKPENAIPTGQAKIPGVKKPFAGTNALPKFNKGGLLDKAGQNGKILRETTQTQIGS